MNLKKSILISILGIASGVIIFTAIFVFQLSNNMIHNPNGWATVRGVGSVNTDPLSKALIAKIGIFANSKEQAIYFIGYAGEPGIIKRLLSKEKLTSNLQGGTHYRITGNVNIPSNWWSITLYNEKDFLHGNRKNRFSFSNFSVKADADGKFVIDVSPTKTAGSVNWLPSPKNGGFSLKLRIYEPLPELYNNIAAYELPKILKVGSL